MSQLCCAIVPLPSGFNQYFQSENKPFGHVCRLRLDMHAPGNTKVSRDLLDPSQRPWHMMQAMWVQFAPPAAVADASSWQMYKLGRPISPLDVVYNGSQSMHAVSDEGISVTGSGSGSWEQLNIR